MFARSLALVLGAAAFAAPFPEPHNNQKETIPVLTSADALTKLHLPEGLLQAFTPEQQRDLLAYLMGNSQVPLAK